MPEGIIDAIDSINKVGSILDFLSNEMKDNGLCAILSQCQGDLVAASQLIVSINEQKTEDTFSNKEMPN